MGKAKIDMAQYAMLGHKEHHTVLQMPFTAGKTFTQALPFGQLRLKINAHMIKVKPVACHEYFCSVNALCHDSVASLARTVGRSATTPSAPLYRGGACKPN